MKKPENTPERLIGIVTHGAGQSFPVPEYKGNDYGLPSGTVIRYIVLTGIDGAFRILGDAPKPGELVTLRKIGDLRGNDTPVYEVEEPKKKVENK